MFVVRNSGNMIPHANNYGKILRRGDTTGKENREKENWKPRPFLPPETPRREDLVEKVIYCAKSFSYIQIKEAKFWQFSNSPEIFNSGNLAIFRKCSIPAVYRFAENMQICQKFSNPVICRFAGKFKFLKIAEFPAIFRFAGNV